MSLAGTRAIIDAIHSGALAQAEMLVDPNFGLRVPTTCPQVDRSILQPAEAWQDKLQYQVTATKLAELFHKNFQQFAAGCSPAICAAGPAIGRIGSG